MIPASSESKVSCQNKTRKRMSLDMEFMTEEKDIVVNKSMDYSVILQQPKHHSNLSNKRLTLDINTEILLQTACFIESNARKGSRIERRQTGKWNESRVASSGHFFEDWR